MVYCVRLFHHEAESTKFKDIQDRQTKQLILHVQNKHTLLKLSNKKRSTLRLTKLKLYNAKKFEK